MTQINLNCDMAEGFGIYTIGSDDALLGLIGAANVACGFHGGDPTIMRRFVARAHAAGVGIGAHPGFADVQGFGRRRIAMAAEEVEDMVLYQIGALQAVARAAGCRVGHVKPHGALANMAAEVAAFADAITRATAAAGDDLVLIALAGSQQEKSARDLGVRVAREGYVDRLYDDDGNLASRTIAGALYDDPARAAAQACAMVFEGHVVTRSGHRLPVDVDTLCVHGDGPDAVAIATAVVDGLRAGGAELVTLDRMPLDGGRDFGRTVWATA